MKFFHMKISHMKYMNWKFHIYDIFNFKYKIFPHENFIANEIFHIWKFQILNIWIKSFIYEFKNFITLICGKSFTFEIYRSKKFKICTDDIFPHIEI